MTQAFNLAQLANNLNTSGQLDATDGLNGLVANANLASSGSPSSSTYLRGDRTWASLPGFGKVLQVVQTVKSDTFTTGAANWVDVTGLSVSITPSSSSSRIYVMATLNSCMTGGGSNGYRLVRNSTAISIGDAAGSRPRFSGNNQDGTPSTSIFTSNVNFVDSPATTSSTTYKIQVFSLYGGDIYVNRTGLDRDTTQYDSRTVSSIIVMEIGA